MSDDTKMYTEYVQCAYTKMPHVDVDVLYENIKKQRAKAVNAAVVAAAAARIHAIHSEHKSEF